MNKMMKNIHTVKNEIDDYMNSGNDEIGEVNIHTLSTISKGVFILTLIFIYITPIFIWEWKISIYHYMLLGLMLVAALVSDVMRRKQVYKKRAVSLVIVCFMMIWVVIFSLLDTADCPYAAQSFTVVFLVIAPVLFIVPLEPMLIFQVIFTIIFIAMVNIFKEDKIIGGDCFGAIYGCAVGIVLYFIVMRLRIREFKQKSIYKQSSEIDYLTKIDNRVSSKRKIDQYLLMKDEESKSAMIVLDVDKFKEVNDKLGHEKGDEVLVEVAKVLQKVFRKGDIIGRFGGDEFVIFLKDIDGKSILESKCKQMNEEMKTVLGGRFKISCSMGVCFLTKGSATDEEMFHIADEALYEAKAFGRATFVVHEYQRRELVKEELPLMVIIDDSMVDREVLGVQFEEKYRIRKFGDSNKALAFIEESATDISIILLDLLMPGIDGLEILREIKRKPEVAWIPVVAVSSDSELEEKALKNGAADMITKPIVPAVTKLRVNNVMNRREK